MPRHELHTNDVKIDQHPNVDLDTIDPDDREPEIVKVENASVKKDYLDELAFNEEPITIRIEPSADKNAATAHPVWCNGKGAEVLVRGKWLELTYLPVGQELITKRKYVAIMLGAKITSVETVVGNAQEDRPRNEVRRITTSACTFSVLEDRNPRGPAWFSELRRRNF